MSVNDAPSFSDCVASVSEKRITMENRGMILTGKTEVFWENPFQEPLFPLQIPHVLNWKWTPASAVRCQQLLGPWHRPINNVTSFVIPTVTPFRIPKSSCQETKDRIFSSVTQQRSPPPPIGPEPPYYRAFTITLRYIIVGRTPLEEWSARRGDLYLTTQNIHKRHPCPAGFEPAIPESERQQTQALDRAATGIGGGQTYCSKYRKKLEVAFWVFAYVVRYLKFIYYRYGYIVVHSNCLYQSKTQSARQWLKKNWCITGQFDTGHEKKSHSYWVQQRWVFSYVPLLFPSTTDYDELISSKSSLLAEILIPSFLLKNRWTKPIGRKPYTPSVDIYSCNFWQVCKDELKTVINSFSLSFDLSDFKQCIYNCYKKNYEEFWHWQILLYSSDM